MRDSLKLLTDNCLICGHTEIQNEFLIKIRHQQLPNDNIVEDMVENSLQNLVCQNKSVHKLPKSLKELLD